MYIIAHEYILQKQIPFLPVEELALVGPWVQASKGLLFLQKGCTSLPENFVPKSPFAFLFLLDYTCMYMYMP